MRQSCCTAPTAWVGAQGGPFRSFRRPGSNGPSGQRSAEGGDRCDGIVSKDSSGSRGRWEPIDKITTFAVMKDDLGWVFINQWHRIGKGDLTLCGTAQSLVRSTDCATRDDAWADIRAHETSVCGPCDSRQDAKMSQPYAGIDPRRDSLTPEQQVIFDRRQADQARRKAFRDAAEIDRSAKRSTSVRTVAGGLSGHGRRR